MTTMARAVNSLRCRLKWLLLAGPVRWLAAMLVSACVVSAFFSHWSLLDGAPRNSLRLFLDGTAERPFAYRVLAPALVRTVDAMLPLPVQDFLADQIAPSMRVRYVEPMLPIYEPFFPGITVRAHTDWSKASYRRSYVLMALFMLLSFSGALLLMRRAAGLLGATDFKAYAVTLLYAFITPTMFLNGGYFYDFTEQLGAIALICCVLQARWLPALLVLLIMQANKETALLMMIFLTPYAWRTVRVRRHMLAPAVLALVLCGFMLLCIRSTFSGLPGQPTEWHLQENLLFWTRGLSWHASEDFHQAGVALPRMSFLYFAVAALVVGWWRQAGPTALAASVSFLMLGVLLLCMGFRDEFRNLSLALPLLVLMLAENKAGAASLTSPPEPNPGLPN